MGENGESQNASFCQDSKFDENLLSKFLSFRFWDDNLFDTVIVSAFFFFSLDYRIVLPPLWSRGIICRSE